MNEQNLREIVNPVFNTAKSCVQLTAAAGDKDAKKLLDTLGLEEFGSSMSERLVPKEILEQVKRLGPAYTVLLETRFQSMNRLIEERKGRQIVDLPCGYTSRGIRLSRQGRIYYGFDLPAVVDAIGPAVETIIGKNDGIQYHAVDATNYPSLEAGLTQSSHDLMITTEGLLMYFSQSELDEVFSNIYSLLKKYGGSWVIVDRAYFLHDRDIVAAALNHDKGLIGLYEAITGKAAGSTADVQFNGNVYFDRDDRKVKEYIRSHGFKLKEICIEDYLPDYLGSLDGLPDAEAGVREIFKGMQFWELSVDQRTGNNSGNTITHLPFKVGSELEDGVFRVTIQGRMDTITAPEVLRQFQDAEKGITAVHVDASRMTYISSAGLRVLLMMYKSVAEKENFSLTGVSEEIRYILETTGFDQLLLGRD